MTNDNENQTVPMVTANASISRTTPAALAPAENPKKIFGLLSSTGSKRYLDGACSMGPPGTGKTTSILALAHELLGPNYKEAVLELNASDDRNIERLIQSICALVNRSVKSPVDISMDITRLIQTLNMSTTAFRDSVKMTLEAEHTSTSHQKMLFSVGLLFVVKVLEPMNSCLLFFYYPWKAPKRSNNWCISTVLNLSHLLFARMSSLDCILRFIGSSEGIVLLLSSGRHQTADVGISQPLDSNEISNEGHREDSGDFHDFLKDGSETLYEGSKFQS
uniref:Probable replication factor C subunit 2 n=1 Tax=Nicotiana sylvestris TaxID=4096 RepID=A0A1U7WV41_NICSY|nr:PREDICTED: probable replication factor C subunit 2 [Nicotiana sylvestris]